MSVDALPGNSFRFVGRSFMAFVLAPEPPLQDWLTALDGWIERSRAFMAGRPVIVDLSKLELTRPALAGLLAELQARSVRIISVEGVDLDWPGSGLGPLPGGIGAGRAIRLDEPAPGPVHGQAPAPITRAAPGAAPPRNARATPAGLLIDEPVRSGRTVVYPDGDVTVLGAIASGAEVIAGGSIHVYGPLRGRAIAGTGGNVAARVFCRRFEPELVAIDGLYRTADEADPALIRRPVQAWLEGTIMHLRVIE